VETESQEELSAYQEMTPKEAADVLKLMEEYEPLVNNSVAFAEQLSNDLHVLDEVRGPRAVTQPKRRCLAHRGTGLSLWVSAALLFSVSTWFERKLSWRCDSCKPGGCCCSCFEGQCLSHCVLAWGCPEQAAAAWQPGAKHPSLLSLTTLGGCLAWCLSDEHGD